MKDLNLQKFQNNLDQKERLLATGDAYIVEANDWHDNFFGECVCENCPKDKMPEGGPLNHLGKILMEVRLQLK